MRGLKRMLMLGAAAAGLSLSGAARGADAKVEFFEAKIRPVLAQSCVGCHGAEKQKGGLRLDTREALLAGGKEEGKPVVVYDEKAPDKSMILTAISYKDDEHAMPPPRKDRATGKTVSQKLSDEKIAAITQWLKDGAVYGEKPVEPIKK